MGDEPVHTVTATGGLWNSQSQRSHDQERSGEQWRIQDHLEVGFVAGEGGYILPGEEGLSKVWGCMEYSQKEFFLIIDEK